MTHTQLGEQADATSTARTCTYYLQCMHAVDMVKLPGLNCWQWRVRCKLRNVSNVLSAMAASYSFIFLRTSLSLKVSSRLTLFDMFCSLTLTIGFISQRAGENVAMH